MHDCDSIVPHQVPRALLQHTHRCIQRLVGYCNNYQRAHADATTAMVAVVDEVYRAAVHINSSSIIVLSTNQQLVWSCLLLVSACPATVIPSKMPILYLMDPSSASTLAVIENVKLATLRKNQKEKHAEWFCSIKWVKNKIDIAHMPMKQSSLPTAVVKYPDIWIIN